MSKDEVVGDGARPRARRPRRHYVAPPRNLGPASDALFDVPRPAPTTPQAPAAQKSSETSTAGEPADGGTGRSGRGATTSDILPARASEDSDAAWGEHGTDGNEDRLQRDRPPHWE